MPDFFLHMRAHARIHTGTYVYILTHTHINLTDAILELCAQISINTYMHIHTCIYTCTHTYIQGNKTTISKEMN